MSSHNIASHYSFSPDANSLKKADLLSCQKMLAGGSRSFFAAARVLPRAVSEPATALYAFCRLADDAVDLNTGGTPALEDALAQLRERLHRAYQDRPLPTAVDRALATVVHQFAIPYELPEALLEGIEWDARERRYETLSELYAYSARVAGAVGAMMAVVMGVRTADAVARACDLGVAMQLTNIARDVGEDARAGRLYLPRQWLREEGIDPERWLKDPIYNTALGRVIQRLLQSAEQLYRQASVGITCLPLRCQPGIQAARLLYAEIGREVERCGLDSVSQRAIVSGQRKLQVLAQALLTTSLPKVADHAEILRLPPLPETRFLVSAVTATPFSKAAVQKKQLRTRRKLDDQIAWLFDLFERLEQRDQGFQALHRPRRMATEVIAPVCRSR